jgi:hypothetical protein
MLAIDRAIDLEGAKDDFSHRVACSEHNGAITLSRESAKCRKSQITRSRGPLGVGNGAIDIWQARGVARKGGGEGGDGRMKLNETSRRRANEAAHD